MNSEIVLVSVAALMGLGWLVLKVVECFERRAQWRREQALLALEAGVERTYQVYVKAIKQGRTLRTLTDDEKARARSLAIARGKALAKDAGVDLISTLGGDDYLGMWIARIVARRRGVGV